MLALSICLLGGVVDLNSENCTHQAFVSKKTIQYCLPQPLAYQKVTGAVSFNSENKTALFLDSQLSIEMLDVSITTSSIGSDFTLIGLGTSVVARNLSVYISRSSGYCNGILPVVSLAQLSDCRIEVRGGNFSYGLAKTIHGRIDLDGVYIQIVGGGIALGKHASGAEFRMIHCKFIELPLETGGIVKNVVDSRISIFVDVNYTNSQQSAEFDKIIWDPIELCQNVWEVVHTTV